MNLQIVFDFTNIGSVLGAAVSLIGSFAIDFGRGLIVDGVKKVSNLLELFTLLYRPLKLTLFTPSSL